jgi:hypothetical protein
MENLACDQLLSGEPASHSRRHVEQEGMRSRPSPLGTWRHLGGQQLGGGRNNQSRVLQRANPGNDTERRPEYHRVPRGTSGHRQKATFGFTLVGESSDFTAEEVECVGCKITNKEVTSKAGAIAYGEGKLRFKKASVMEPAGCTIESETGVVGEVITKTLTFHGDLMDTNKANQKAFVHFIPAAGETTTFALYTLSGEKCRIAGTSKIVGSIFGESLNNTGVSPKTQGLVFSPAVLETSGGFLTYLNAPVTLTMTINYSVVGGTEYTIK